MSAFLFLLVIIAAVAVIGVVMYNSLIRKKNEVDEAWSGIEVQMKRRYDLIPNLVNTVKGYADHEKGVLEGVTKARTEAMNSGGSVTEHAEHENMLTGALKSVFALAENYPDLKANQNFLELQTELSDTEDKLMAARRFYNSAVKSLNISLESVPTNIIGNSFGFKKREFFELAEAEKAQAEKPVEVKF